MRRGDRVAVVLALASGAYPLVDGLRAVFVGDYFAPGGQLGPWSLVVQAVGVAPRSPLMHAVFIALGLGFLLAAAAFVLRWRPGRAALMTMAVLGLWYLPFGTLFGLAELALLWRGRAARADG